MTYTITLKPEASALPMRDRVYEFEAMLLKLPQLEIIPRHYFSDGAYAREITIPAGTTLTGKIHLMSQINILSKGEISVLTEDGMVRVKAPFTVVSPPGTKRVAYAHTECVWTTILGTDEKDPYRIEALFTTMSEQEYLAHVARIEGSKRYVCLESEREDGQRAAIDIQKELQGTGESAEAGRKSSQGHRDRAVQVRPMHLGCASG